MVAARKRENQNRINDKIYLFFYGKETLQYEPILDWQGSYTDERHSFMRRDA